MQVLMYIERKRVNVEFVGNNQQMDNYIENLRKQWLQDDPDSVMQKIPVYAVGENIEDEEGYVLVV